jgi:hypothetical protein
MKKYVLGKNFAFMKKFCFMKRLVEQLVFLNVVFTKYFVEVKR